MKKNKGLGDPDKNLNEKTNNKEGGKDPRRGRGGGGGGRGTGEKKRVLGRV